MEGIVLIWREMFMRDRVGMRVWGGDIGKVRLNFSICIRILNKCN